MASIMTRDEREKFSRLTEAQTAVKTTADAMADKAEAMAAAIKSGKNRGKNKLYRQVNSHELMDAAQELIDSIKAMHDAESQFSRRYTEVYGR